MKKGFTLVEILVAMSLGLVIMGFGVSNFRDTIRRQTVEQTAEKINQVLQQARSNALAGRKDCSICRCGAGPAPTNVPLIGWEVAFTSSSYTLRGLCGTNPVLPTPFYTSGVQSVPAGVSMVSNPGTSVTFKPLGAGTNLASNFSSVVYQPGVIAKAVLVTTGGDIVPPITTPIPTGTPAPTVVPTSTLTPTSTSMPTNTPFPTNTPNPPTPTPTTAANIVYQGTVTGGSDASTTVSTSTSVAGVSGSFYIAAVATRGSVDVLSVTGMGLSWSQVVQQCSRRRAQNVEIWIGSGTPVTGVVTATMASSPTILNALIAVSRYTGVNLVTPTGSIVSGNTSGVSGVCISSSDSTLDTASYSLPLPVSAGNMVFAAVAERNRANTPIGMAERIEVYRGTSGNVNGLAVEDQVSPSTTTFSVAGTLSATVDWSVAAVEIRR